MTCGKYKLGRIVHNTGHKFYKLFLLSAVTDRIPCFDKWELTDSGSTLAGMGKVLENCFDDTTAPLSSLSSCLPPTSTERPSSLTWTLSSSGAKPSTATEASSTDATTSVDSLSGFSGLGSTGSAFFSSSICLAFLGATILRDPSFWFSLEWMASTLQSGGSESDLLTRREETMLPLASFSSCDAFSLSIPSDTLISMSSGEKPSTGTENSTE